MSIVENILILISTFCHEQIELKLQCKTFIWLIVMNLTQSGYLWTHKMIIQNILLFWE